MSQRMWTYFDLYEVLIVLTVIIIYVVLCSRPFITLPWRFRRKQEIMDPDQMNTQSSHMLLRFAIRTLYCVLILFLGVLISVGIYYQGVYSWTKISKISFLISRLDLRSLRIVIISVAADICTPLLILFARLTGNPQYRYKWKEVIMLLIQTSVVVICLNLISGAPKYYHYELLAIYSRIEIAIVSVIGIVAMVVFDQYVADKKREKEVLKLEKAITENYNYYHNQEKMQDEIRRMYHDMKKHFQVLGSMNDVDEIHDYIQSMYVEVKVAEGFYHTGNRIADIILNEKKQKAERQQTVLEIVVENNCLNHLEPVHICTILSNILDNALEACRKQTMEKRYIRMKIFENEQGLFINLKNSMEQQPKVAEGNFLSTKLDGFHHGIGMNSVKAAVKKYGGDMQVDWDQNCFHILIMMPVMHE